MADRSEVSKVTAFHLTGKEDAVKAPKVVAYLLLEPGDSDDGSNKQGHVHCQILRRD